MAPYKRYVQGYTITGSQIGLQGQAKHLMVCGHYSPVMAKLRPHNLFLSLLTGIQVTSSDGEQMLT